MADQCEHNVKPNSCTACLLKGIRKTGAAGVVCALCDRVGHAMRYCHMSSVGRARVLGQMRNRHAAVAK
jgi:hypothetical protein